MAQTELFFVLFYAFDHGATTINLKITIITFLLFHNFTVQELTSLACLSSIPVSLILCLVLYTIIRTIIRTIQ